MAAKKRKHAAPLPDKVKLSTAVIQTMLESQKADIIHSKVSKQLKALYGTVEHDSFIKSFIQCMKRAMEQDTGNPYASNVLKFVATFVADSEFRKDNGNHPIVVSVFQWLLTTISDKQLIRVKICQLVNRILDTLGPKAALNVTICDRILQYMLDHMRDVSQHVRVQAVLALQRLQNPTDPEDAVVRTYIYHLSHDPSPKVRQAIITCIGKNNHTIPVIIERLWDVDEAVRRHTYLQMSGYPVRQYMVIQRIKFLEQGLNDRAERVSKVVKSVMIPQWIDAYQRQYVTFLRALKIDADEDEMDRFRKTAKRVLCVILSKHGINDMIGQLKLDGECKTIPLSELTFEHAICWHALIDFLQDNDSDQLDDVLVDLTTFSEYLKQITEEGLLNKPPSVKSSTRPLDKLEKLYFQYSLLTLLEMLSAFDFGDEYGRKCLEGALYEVLCKLELEEMNVKTILTIFERLMPDNEHRFRFFVDLINVILEPAQTDILESSRALVENYRENTNLKTKISLLRHKILDLREQENAMILKKNYASAQRVTENLNRYTEEYATLLEPILQQQAANSTVYHNIIRPSKNLTLATINKCLQICFYLVSSPKVHVLTPNVCELQKTFISRCLADLATREWALRALTALSMLYDGLSKDTFHLLYRQLNQDSPTRIWQVSIDGIFELLDRYGLEHFYMEEEQKAKPSNARQLYNKMDYLDQEVENDSGTRATLVNLMRLMVHFMESGKDKEISASIVNGFCRIILHGHYTSEEIVSQLMLRYFNPATVPKLQQILGIFFEDLVIKKRQEVLQLSLVKTLTAIVEAPSGNHLKEIRPEHVLKFVINSTKAAFCKSGANLHNAIATSMLNLMVNHFNCKDFQKLLSRELLKLEIIEDATAKKRLIDGIETVLHESSLDPVVTKNLTTFMQMLEKVYRDSDMFATARKAPEEIVKTEDTLKVEPKVESDDTVAVLVNLSPSEPDESNVKIESSSSVAEELIGRKKKKVAELLPASVMPSRRSAKSDTKPSSSTNKRKLLEKEQVNKLPVSSKRTNSATGSNSKTLANSNPQKPKDKPVVVQTRNTVNERVRRTLAAKGILQCRSPVVKLSALPLPVPPSIIRKSVRIAKVTSSNDARVRKPERKSSVALTGSHQVAKEKGKDTICAVVLQSIKVDRKPVPRTVPTKDPPKQEVTVASAVRSSLRNAIRQTKAETNAPIQTSKITQLRLSSRRKSTVPDVAVETTPAKEMITGRKRSIGISSQKISPVSGSNNSSPVRKSRRIAEAQLDCKRFTRNIRKK